MHGSKAQHLSSLFRSAVNKIPTITDSSSKAPVLENLENFTKFQTYSTTKRKNKLLKKLPRVSSSKSTSCLGIESDSVKLSSSSLQEAQEQIPEESQTNAYNSICNILCPRGESNAVSASSNLPAVDVLNNDQSQEAKLEEPWFAAKPNCSVSDRTKLISRVRKEKWVGKNKFQKLLSICGEKLGIDTTFQYFGKVGLEPGKEEYKSLIGFCVEKARESQNENDSLDHIHKGYQLLTAMKERGFEAEDGTYGLLLLYLIDMKMVDDFGRFCKVIKDTNSSVLPRLGYYEMLLWIKVGNDDKVQELCHSVGCDADTDDVQLAENYLLAFCETDRKIELLQFLEVVNIMNVSSPENVAILFKSLGRLLLEEHAERLIQALRASVFGRDAVW